MYFMSLMTCKDDCNNRGLCVLGRCTCNLGYHGYSCEHVNCPNSLVYVDIDTLDT